MAIRKLQRRIRGPTRSFFLSSSLLASFVLRSGPGRPVSLLNFLALSLPLSLARLLPWNPEQVQLTSCCFRLWDAQFSCQPILTHSTHGLIALGHHPSQPLHTHWHPHFQSATHMDHQNLILTLHLMQIIASRASAASTLWPVAKCGIGFPTPVLNNLRDCAIDWLVALSVATLGCVHNYHHSDPVCDVSS